MLFSAHADDCLNLPVGLLCAGAKCVISTLWPVNDLPSALLMAKFHELWRNDKGQVVRSPAAALCEAQRWLREDIRTGDELVDFVLEPLLARIADGVTVDNCWRVAREYKRLGQGRPPFESPAYWAPYICTGWAFEGGPEPD